MSKTNTAVQTPAQNETAKRVEFKEMDLVELSGYQPSSPEESEAHRKALVRALQSGMETVCFDKRTNHHALYIGGKLVARIARGNEVPMPKAIASAKGLPRKGDSALVSDEGLLDFTGEQIRAFDEDEDNRCVGSILRALARNTSSGVTLAGQNKLGGATLGLMRMTALAKAGNTVRVG